CANGRRWQLPENAAASQLRRRAFPVSCLQVHRVASCARSRASTESSCGNSTLRWIFKLRTEFPLAADRSANPVLPSPAEWFLWDRALLVAAPRLPETSCLPSVWSDWESREA